MGRDARPERSDPSPGRAPGFLPRRVREQWTSLADPGGEPALVADPPDTVARWLDRVAPAGASRGAFLRMHGEIRLGRWRPFRADQVIGPDGFIWAARAGRGPMTVSGHDRYVGGSGGMDWRLLGLVPVMRQSGDDVTRSAAGRFAAELLVLTPANARTGVVHWAEPSPGRALATVTVGGSEHRVTLRFDDGARLLDLSLPRWGDPDGEGFREEVFGVAFDGERRFGDVVLPSSFTAGWWPGTERGAGGEFFRCHLDDVVPA